MSGSVWMFSDQIDDEDMKRNVKTNRQRLLKQRQCTNWSL